MRRKAISLAAAVAGLVAAPAIASAMTAVTTEPVPLRAGPAIDFPVVDSIPDDARVNVHGCVRAYRWCDVSWRDARGWVQGDDLSYYYQQSYVPIIEYGPRIGLPLVVFSFDTYWDRHYRGRPWYGQRTRWRTVWRERDRRDGRSDRVDRRDGKGDRDGRDRKADRTPNRVEKRADRTDDRTKGKADRSDRKGDRSDRKADRSDRQIERRSREATQTPRRNRDAGQTQRRDSGPRPEASLRERPRPGAGRSPQREGGGSPQRQGGGGGGSERRDRN
jgi:uncharacterized protein YraI